MTCWTLGISRPRAATSVVRRTQLRKWPNVMNIKLKSKSSAKEHKIQQPRILPQQFKKQVYTVLSVGHMHCLPLQKWQEIYLKSSLETVILKAKLKNANVAFSRSILLPINKYITLLDPVFPCFSSFSVHKNARTNCCSMRKEGMCPCITLFSALSRF